MSKRSAAQKEADAFCDFLGGFNSSYALASAAETAEAAQTARLLPDFFRGYKQAIDCWRQDQESKADDFSLFGVMELTGSEIRHSMILAWLLDWDMTSHGTHAQGNLGFRLFLQEFKLPVEYAEGAYLVQRERSGDEARIDVEVAEPRKFVIHIENKIWSGESVDQTDREWRDLEKRAESLDCPIDRCHAFYLTPDGRKPLNKDFYAISWRRMADVFKRFEREAKAAEVKLFARHYAKVLKRHIIQKTLKEENNDVD
ncbi:MAG: PD-(D/E)XK nuclease family protein [Planctomycetota bacterium]